MGKRLVILIFIVSLCSLVVFFNQPSKRNKKTKYLLTQKEIIIDEAQFVFKPVFEETNNNYNLKFLVEITSYINPDLIDLNYSNITMLEFKDNIYKANEYEIIEKTNHKLIAQLIFKPKNFEINKNFLLKVFTYDENEISWN